MSGSITKVLIANRGEIAIRVARTCRDLGIRTVAVFSEADRAALHVRAADEAQFLGGAPASESYLNVERVLEAAKRSGADALHPGYGFLSENAAFARACEDAGIVFLGPPAAAIQAMGDKPTARRLMAEAGVPMAPGTPDPVDETDAAVERAREIGFPVLIKPAAGGGGKGMRIVEREEDLPAAMAAARREAASAFGDPRVYLEKYLPAPKHIEVQVLADDHGNVVHLFERECSVQRRHQKVIEEAPSPAVDDALRAQIGAAAVEAARACGYRSAGTVEFLLDADGRFYFMEMNTRIQVEHPVTEMITGLDLVAEQISIAEGNPLSIRQEDVRRSGHAIECRIYAEDPENAFLPDPGVVNRHRPASGPGIRVDAGLDEGERVHLHYDPMIAKLIAWGRSRDEALRRMRRALDEYEVSGVRTTIPFCRFVVDHPTFRHGDATTRFVEEHFAPERLAETVSPEHARLAAIAAVLHAEARGPSTQPLSPAASNRQSVSSAWLARRRY